MDGLFFFLSPPLMHFCLSVQTKVQSCTPVHACVRTNTDAHTLCLCIAIVNVPKLVCQFNFSHRFRHLDDIYTSRSVDFSLFFYSVYTYVLLIDCLFLRFNVACNRSNFSLNFHVLESGFRYWTYRSYVWPFCLFSFILYFFCVLCSFLQNCFSLLFLCLI